MSKSHKSKSNVLPFQTFECDLAQDNSSTEPFQEHGGGVSILAIKLSEAFIHFPLN